MLGKIPATIFLGTDPTRSGDTTIQSPVRRMVRKGCGGGAVKSLKVEAPKAPDQSGPQSKGFGPESETRAASAKKFLIATLRLHIFSSALGEGVAQVHVLIIAPAGLWLSLTGSIDQTLARMASATAERGARGQGGVNANQVFKW
jgi:hypothetical protein